MVVRSRMEKRSGRPIAVSYRGPPVRPITMCTSSAGAGCEYSHVSARGRSLRRVGQKYTMWKQDEQTPGEGVRRFTLWGALEWVVRVVWCDLGGAGGSYGAIVGGLGYLAWWAFLFGQWTWGWCIHTSSNWLFGRWIRAGVRHRTKPAQRRLQQWGSSWSEMRSRLAMGWIHVIQSGRCCIFFSRAAAYTYALFTARIAATAVGPL